MADVLIRGMEMPEERERFTLTVNYNGLVFDTKTGIQVAEAQEVFPHGNLIDADALKAWFIEWYDLDADLEVRHILDIITDETVAPIVISASE